jgi:FixJ family two-component response regulator
MDITGTVKALKAGADNFFIKPVRSDELLKALEKAIARHETALALKGELEALRARLSTLTLRQRQIFEIIVRGKTNKHAARELGSSVRTIKAHRQVITKKNERAVFSAACHHCRAARRCSASVWPWRPELRIKI